jgi:hypothetical protein
VAHNVGSPMRHVHSLPCCESLAHPASTLKAILAPSSCATCLAVFHGLLFPVAVGDVSADAFPGELHLLYSHNVALGMLSASVVKFAFHIVLSLQK